MINKFEIIRDEIIKEIVENRAKILDDFFKVYLASRWTDYFSKQEKIDFNRIELVEQRKENEIVYFFRLKKGKLRKSKT